MFGKDSVKIKGVRTGVTGVLWRFLKRREKEGDLLAIEIDEYKTSKNCYLCYGNKTLKEVEGTKGVSVKACNKCHTIWQRDVNAAKNMSLISSYVWNNRPRPAIYQRQLRT